MNAPAQPTTSGLPTGFSVRLNRSVREYDSGRTLVGGAPTTAVFLKDEAAGLLQHGRLRVSNANSEVLAERLMDLGMADPVAADLPEIDPGSVTVVIPVRDRQRQLERLLSSLGGGLRVIVVDDCSRNPAPIASVADAHGAEIVRHAVNLGPSAARNTGLRVVRTPFVAFVDCDVVMNPDALPILLRHFHDEKVTLVAPRILGADPVGGRTWLTRYEDGRASLDLGRYPSIVRPRSPVAWVPSACVVARVAALGDGFSAELRVAEDVDLVWRLAGQGCRIRYEPAAVVRHEHRPGLRQWWGRKVYYGTGAHHLAARHGKDVAPAVMTVWTATAAVSILLQRRWSVPVAVAVSAVASERIAKKLDRSGQARRISIRLTADGLMAALSQSSALMLRHWWPLAAVSSLFSVRARRALLVAGVVDAAIEFSRTDSDLDPLRFAVARRMDDLAYGTGVWLGALRHRSVKCLLPDLQLPADKPRFR